MGMDEEKCLGLVPTRLSQPLLAKMNLVSERGTRLLLISVEVVDGLSESLEGPNSLSTSEAT